LCRRDRAQESKHNELARCLGMVGHDVPDRTYDVAIVGAGPAGVVALTGAPEGRLERVRWRHAPTGAETERAIRNVFLFIGADPATNWLRACGVGLDDKGFVPTGSQAGVGGGATNGTPRPPLPLESNVLGVFAVGRSGSLKRVGGAIGEGAAVVAQLHSYLAASRLQQAAQSYT
jgi:thioredoxin reductase (NADPH)